MARKREIEVQGYIPAFFIVGLSIITYCYPLLSDLFIYDRQAILDGEFWRLLTSPFVHFSKSHLFWNILIFGIAGVAVNASKFPRFWIVCGISISVSGLVFLLATPEIAYYGGLSGLATGAAAYLCLCHLFKNGSKKRMWLIILVVMVIKMIVEAAFDEYIFAHADEVPFRVVPAAHIVGYLGAITPIVLTWTGNFLQKHHNRKQV